VERLQHWFGEASAPAEPAVWAERLRTLMADFARPVDDADRKALEALDAALDQWLTSCEAAAFAQPVPLEIARAAWLQALDEPQLAQRFRAGGVTFCTLLPLRAIPFEVVCLLGMNDGDYPRRSPRSDFDLMALPGMARPGDRSRQGDDRQLMLEALLSARRVLLVSWTGRSVRDNSVQPPSVLVSQLRDYLAAGWGQEALDARTTEHPLQAFSRRYFTGAVQAGDQRWFTYAREWRAVHETPVPAAGAQEAVPAAEGAAPRSLTLDRLGGRWKTRFRTTRASASRAWRSTRWPKPCWTGSTRAPPGAILPRWRTSWPRPWPPCGAPAACPWRGWARAPSMPCTASGCPWRWPGGRNARTGARLRRACASPGCWMTLMN